MGAEPPVALAFAIPQPTALATRAADRVAANRELMAAGL